MPVLSRCMELGGTVGGGVQYLHGSLCPVRVIVPTFFGSAVLLYLMVKHGLPSALWLLCLPDERAAHVFLEMG